MHANPPLRSRTISTDLQTFLMGALRVGDACVVAATGILAYWLREADFDLPTNYQAALAAGVLLTINYFHFARLYNFSDITVPIPQFGRLAFTWIVVLATLVFIAYFTKSSEDYSRIWAALWFSFSFIGFLFLRFLALLQTRRWRRTGDLTLNAAVVGAGPLGEALARHLVQSAASGIRLVGFFDDARASLPEKVGEFPVLGTVADLPAYSQTHKVDEVIVAIPWSEGENLLGVLKKLRTLPLSIYLCPEIVNAPIPIHKIDRVAGWPMLTVQERPLSGWDLVTKTVEDLVLGSFLLLLLSPAMLLIAAVIKLDSPGPVIFSQRRYGFYNNPIHVYKFRTMCHTKESASAAKAEGDVAQARRGDPRITRVGAFLRRTSLDELPQLINVLQRRMSLVGPRPHAVVHNQQYAAIIDDYLGRHRMKPGITGWAQVNGLRGETDTFEKMRRRVQYDLYYVDNWSLFFDIKILFLTFLVPFMQENAY